MIQKHHTLIFEIIRVLLVTLFTYAACSKLYDYYNFQLQVGNNISHQYAYVLSWLVPLIEMLIALMLIIETTTTAGLVAFAVLMFAFSLYIIVLLARHKQLPCSCGGLITSMSWAGHLAFNIFFIALSILAMVLRSNNNASFNKRSESAYW